MEQQPICFALHAGHPCDRLPIMNEPVPLCELHRLQVALAAMPDIVRDQLANVARPVDVEQLLQGWHDPVVYFTSHGGRVKIGYTTNLKSRIKALCLPAECVVLALDGGADLEHALHARFAESRVPGTEWFETAPAIRRYVEERKRQPAHVHRPRPIVVTRTAPPERPSTEAERSALLDALAEMLGDQPRMLTRTVLRKLTELSPDTYGDWTLQDLNQVLRQANAATGKYNGYSVVRRLAVLAARQAA